MGGGVSTRNRKTEDEAGGNRNEEMGDRGGEGAYRCSGGGQKRGRRMAKLLYV